MKVLLNTERRMGNSAAMQVHLTDAAEQALGHYGSRILRIDAHLSDATGAAKPDVDKVHCKLDARFVEIGVVGVEARAATAHEAIRDALVKLDHALAKVVGNHDDRRNSVGATRDSSR